MRTQSGCRYMQTDNPHVHAAEAEEAYPMRTSTGSTKMAIWMDEPRATPMAKSILFL